MASPIDRPPLLTSAKPGAMWTKATVTAIASTGAIEPAALAQLYRATRQFNDRRLIDALFFVVRRDDRPDATRVSAGTLLFSYAVLGIYLDADELLQGSESPGISGVSHDLRARQTRALLGDLRPELRTVLGSLVATESETRIGRAARTMLDYLGYLSH